VYDVQAWVHTDRGNLARGVRLPDLPADDSLNAVRKVPSAMRPPASSLLQARVGVTLGYPSGRADPLDSDGASVTDVLTTANTTAISTTGSSESTISRQPPTVADTTAAAFQSPTYAYVNVSISPVSI